MALSKCPECGHDVSSLASACPNCGAPVVLAKKQEAEDVTGTTAVSTTRADASASPPAPESERFVSAGVSRWLFAFAVAASGFVSAVLANKLHFGRHDWGPFILPGLSFGLVTGLWWLLREKWFRKREAVIVFIGATVAYAAAYWAALLTFAFLSGKGTSPPLSLGEAGIIGGAAGSVLLGGTLALTLRKFLRNAWHAFLVIGTGSGVALTLGSLGKGEDIPNLANFGTRFFISLWQFAVAAYLCSAIYSCKAPAWLATERALAIRRWTTRLVWAALVVSLIHLAVVYMYEEKQKAASGASTHPDSVNATALPGAPKKQPQGASAEATAWANSYRNAKFMTRAEFLRRVGPVHLTILERGVTEAVSDFGNMVASSARDHGLTISSGPTNVELVVDAQLIRSKITEYVWDDLWGKRENGYSMAYIAAVDIVFDVKANCRRGDQFIELDVYPCRSQNSSHGYMGQWANFNASYANALRQALDSAFDAFGKLTDADDTDDAAAWNASLWPAVQNAEMQKNFLSPMRAESAAASRVFHGVTKIAVGDIELNEEARKEFNATSLQQTWMSELSRNGQATDPSSDVRIFQEVDVDHLSASFMGITGDTLCYFDESVMGVRQRNVVFQFNGELRRADARIWKDLQLAIALPRDNTNAVQGLVSGSIQSAAREFALRR